MADFEYTVEGNIGLMRLNRPEKMNAITYEMLKRDRIGDPERGQRRPGAGGGAARHRARFSAGTDLQQLSLRRRRLSRAESYANNYDPARRGAVDVRFDPTSRRLRR